MASCSGLRKEEIVCWAPDAQRERHRERKVTKATITTRPNTALKGIRPILNLSWLAQGLGESNEQEQGNANSNKSVYLE